jgi:molybdate transport system substrate-binding protein
MKTKSLVLFFSLFICARLFAAELTVHAAASLTDAMKEIGAAYEKESGDTLQFNFGASNMLERQIEQGAPADLFVSADEAKMDALETKGLLLSGTRRSLLSNLLVIIVANDASNLPTSASDLTKPEYKKSPWLSPRPCQPVSTRASSCKSSNFGMP